MFLSDSSLIKPESLGKPELVSKLKTCMSYLTELQNTVNQQQSDLCQLESTVDSQKAEITDMKVRFANHVDKFLSQNSNLKPSYSYAVKEGTSTVLVAQFADGEKPSEPLNVATVEKLLDCEASGLIPQRVREKDNALYITFHDSAALNKATNVLKKKPDCSRLFKNVFQLDVYYPAVVKFVDVSDLDGLKAELEHRNPQLKGEILSLKDVYTKPDTSVGHVKIFLRSKSVLNSMLRRGSVYVFDSTHPLVEPDPNREVREGVTTAKSMAILSVIVKLLILLVESVLSSTVRRSALRPVMHGNVSDVRVVTNLVTDFVLNRSRP